MHARSSRSRPASVRPVAGVDIKSAAKSAARDELVRLDVDVPDYLVGRIVEAAWAVFDAVHSSRPALPPGPPIIDAESWECGDE